MKHKQTPTQSGTPLCRDYCILNWFLIGYENRKWPGRKKVQEHHLQEITLHLMKYSPTNTEQHTNRMRKMKVDHQDKKERKKKKKKKKKKKSLFPPPLLFSFLPRLQNAIHDIHTCTCRTDEIRNDVNFEIQFKCLIIYLPIFICKICYFFR